MWDGRMGSRPRENAREEAQMAPGGASFSKMAVFERFFSQKGLGKPDASPEGFACLLATKKRRLRLTQAAIAAISGLTPRIFITRVKL